MIQPGTPVVFDVNVYLDYILADDGSWPLLPDVPPTTGNAAADAVSLAFAGHFRLYASPHILRNVARVMTAAGQSSGTTVQFSEAIAEMCAFSGGAVFDPEVRDHAISDHEDNHILSLAAHPPVDALIIVSRDRHLLDLGPAWNGRLMMTPRDFVRRVVSH